MSAHESLSPDQFSTHYHLTDRKNFRLDPKKVPHDNAVAIHQRSAPGLYVGNPEHWWNGQGYHRPYVAEIHAPVGAAHEERWGGEKFIPGEHLGEAKVHRVIPVDAYVREKYHEHGWVEEHHGTTFDTGAPTTPAIHQQHEQFKDYKYEGPDVRDFTPAQHAEHKQRLRAFEKGQG